MKKPERKAPLPKEVSIWRHHFLNTKIASLILFFFLLLSFAMFSRLFVFRFVPKEHYVTVYAVIVIFISYICLKKMH
ncbi:MAG: hypothetical protein ABIG96_02560 [Candidatus Micrarchaeota archaeon]